MTTPRNPALPSAMNLMPAPRAAVTTLLFDLDGTLVELQSRRLLELSLMTRITRRFARVISPVRFYRAFWRAVHVAQSHGSVRSNYEVLVRELAAEAEAEPAEIARQLAAFIEEDFPHAEGHFVPVPGAREALLAARERGYRLVLATNPVWPERAVRMRLAWGGLADVPFEFVSHSQVMTRSKPSRAFYRELLERIGERPEECAMIGNDLEKDLPATELGVRTFLLWPRGERRTRPTADPRLDAWGSFDDLGDWLASLGPEPGSLPAPAAPTPAAEPAAAAKAERSTAAGSEAPLAATHRVVGTARNARDERSPVKKTMSPRIICVTGPDGSGKTTQITKLAEHLERSGKHKVAPVTIWDLLLDSSCKGKILFDDPAQVDRYLGILSPTSRALFLYHCMNQALELATKRDVDVILVNAYWYKYYATEVAHGGDRAKLRKLADMFPEPSLTFYLRLPPEEAFARKAMLSAYETGFAEPRSKEAFVRFQNVAHAVLEDLSRELGWVTLDGKATINELTAAMIERIDAYTKAA